MNVDHRGNTHIGEDNRKRLQKNILRNDPGKDIYEDHKQLTLSISASQFTCSCRAVYISRSVSIYFTSV